MWKASELKLFCLYIVPTVLLCVAASETEQIMELIESMVLYSGAVRILTQAQITEDMISSANDLLNHWAKNRALLWSKSAMTFKAHENLHLPKQVLLHGPLSTHSAFAGESAIGKLGENITCHNATVSVKQIAERMDLLRSSTVWLDKYGHPKLKAHFKFNDDVVQIERRIVQPHETITQFLSSCISNYSFVGEITVNGFSICPFQTNDATNCYIAVKEETGFTAVKVMAVVKTFTDELLFCGYSLELLPYSDLMKGDGILAANNYAYQYCCYIDKESFQENKFILCNVKTFLSKYVLIDASNFYFF
uniref:Uncharacterized protein n=1 Tax=Panagrolaimus superbus TaxID=310955 RepID=A0A914Y122_9BILA